MPGTIPYPETNRMSPESMMGDYEQRGLQDIQDRYMQQFNEINKRVSLGTRRQTEMFDELDSRFEQQALVFKQEAAQQRQQFAQIDKLAQQGGFDPYEAKMRIVLGPEAEAAMFPRQEGQRSTAAQYGELDIYERKLKNEARSFLEDPGGKRVKQASKFWFQEKKTTPQLRVWDANLDPQQDKKTGEWTSGGYRTATPDDWRRKGQIDQELENIQRQKQELLGTPDIAKRVRGPMLRIKRDAKTDSLVTRVQKSAGIIEPEPQTPRKQKPERQAVTPTADQLKKLNTKQAYDEGVRLGYWE